MKKGLLLTAFLITLILDMGVGPVLIVFGAVNLSKQTSYPSAAWLMVRGILNCIQFLTVMILTWIVATTKGKYSRKEESMLIARLLTTHPVAYFYYLLILGGIVWNILGSCWIAAAFRHYTVGFASCYLVGVILAWISVIASPFFVFSGGLAYGKIKKDSPLIEPASIQLTSSIYSPTSITNILNNLHNDGFTLTADDILYLSNQEKPNPREPMISLKDDEKPVIVDDLIPSDYSDETEGVSLYDLIPTAERQEGVFFLQRDVLDDEQPIVDSVWHLPGEREQEIINMVPVIQIQEGVGVETVREEEEVKEEVREEEVREEVKEEVREEVKETKEETKEENNKKKKKEKKQKQRFTNAKERIVIPDIPITIPTTQFCTMNMENDSDVTIPPNDQFIDLSEQMRDAMNRGDFHQPATDENVITTSIASSF